ncbi:coiled-coil domain-containing protein 66 isoform X2 [Poecilia reticulata]|uniref:coiled-coil domain-containing protein 66 isoform X2 n=1 Tax=Poecilia reticulata TaxID=8081 RepID=UPI0007EB3CAE|nr:PREDICTED: coiled-coil domain-containing protein 66 isoform X2 [Poecilia reticulata]
MNLGDGLLFELENGKPRLILLTHGVVKNPIKLPSKHRAASILKARQPSCLEEVQPEERTAQQAARGPREVRCKAAAAALSCSSSISTTDGRSSVLNSSKTPGRHKERASKAMAKVKTNKHKLSSAVGPLGSPRRTDPLPNGERGDGVSQPVLGSVDAGLKDGDVMCVTGEQLRELLSSITVSTGCAQRGPEEQAAQGGQIHTNSVSSVNGGEERQIREDEKGEEMKEEGDDECDSLRRSSFSWFKERRPDSRAAIDAKKAQWKRELDEQVALKQRLQLSALSRLQGEEYAESVSSVGHREQPAAIRSSLRLGEVTPMEEMLSVERKEEQRRAWLEELDRQREETAERRKREKLQRRQTEDHERWAAHFDSLQRRAPAQPAAQPAAPGRLSGSERDDWNPSSSLSLVWEGTSSCGADSVMAASVDSTRGFPSRSSYLRTMTSLLDPAQVEERERRRLKQLELQRAIEAQVEERRRQRELEEATRKREEEEEERRVAMEREKLQKQYELEMLKKKEKVLVELQNDPVPPPEQPEIGGSEETPGSRTVTRKAECVENGDSGSSFKDSSVQTEDAPPAAAGDRVQAADVSVQNQNRPAPCGSAEPNSRSRTPRAGKENICLPAGEDPYEPFARTERSRRSKTRPEWGSQRPSRRFVPASERYPVALQRDRQESRLRRQAELLALQKTRPSRTEPPAPQQEARLCPNVQQSRTSPTKKVESGLKGNIDSDRGRSPAAQSQQAPGSPALEFVPYLRTAEVFSLDPLEPADTPPPRTHPGPPPPPEASSPPPGSSHRDPLLHPEMLPGSQRQQEILRGLAQLRQGLLQKQKELETDLKPVRNRRDKEQRALSAAHRT